MKKVFILILSLALCISFPAAAQEEPALSITELSVPFGDIAVRSPQISGIDNADVINQAILDTLGWNECVTQNQQGNSLDVSYECYLDDNIVSVLFSLHGEIPSSRDERAYKSASFMLETGEPITLDSLFTDTDAAVSHMESILWDALPEDLFFYCDNTDISPMPRDCFFIDGSGITIGYGIRSFSLLSGYAGKAHFYPYEIAEYLNTDEGSLALKLWAHQLGLSGKAEREALMHEDFTSGRIAGLPYAIGDNIEKTVNEYRLLTTPDYITGSRIVEFEEARTRGSRVLTDALTSTTQNSEVLGIRAYRASIYGIITTGVSTKADITEAFGEPESSVTLDAYSAQDWQLPAGESVYYTIDGRNLRLHFTEDGILYMIQISGV
ncbi:MAG: hypothetical protein PHI27_08330 [Eubacteriales bacterium]|nr:hypothetical protein [Eubacteriales bacterium]MDD3882245.1 hypothetical protein [Eubacteriales bacterium]MDD4512594.1 hypothetical protein [Eubacteriales bacterium]